jgi:hypothetical protein
MYNDEAYEAIGAQNTETYNQDWKIYKVLMASKSSLSEKIFLKTCLPTNESVTPIVADINGNCTQKINFIEDLKDKSKPFIEKIKKSKIFRTSNVSNNNNKNNNKNIQVEEQNQNPLEIKRLNNNDNNNNNFNMNNNLNQNNIKNEYTNINDLSSASFLQSKIIIILY